MRRPTRRFKTAILALLLAPTFLLGGCGKRENPILRLSAAEALEIGKQLLAEEKYYRAGQHLTHAFEVEPNSRSGREALLLSADALYLDGGTDNYIRCESKYRDFLNRFPTSDRADYAQFQAANCLAARAEKPDRDQSVTVKALEAYQELLRLYPTSPYIPEARKKMQEVTDRLAEHELLIGQFYLRYARGRLCTAAIQRLTHVQQEYPGYSRMDSVLYHLGVAYEKCNRDDDAWEVLRELRSKYPESELMSEVPELEQKLSEEETDAAAG
jgi:outer membrane protein assembly factor BamD